jgi:predicted secreted protein
VPALVLVSGLLLAACADDAGPGRADVRTITEDDAGTTVRLASGEVVEVRLDSNATTGYAWHLQDDELETDVVQVASSDYVADPTPEGEPLAGSGGIEVWRFRAKAPGSATIAMTYSFGEEPDAQIAGEFTFSIVVE